MPPHDRVGLNEHERRTPVPPHAGQGDPKQPVAAPELRPDALASERVQLLAEREVLQDQFVMPAASQRQRAQEDEDDLQHASILSVFEPRGNGQRGRLRFGEGQPLESQVRRHGAERAPGHQAARGREPTFEAHRRRTNAAQSVRAGEIGQGILAALAFKVVVHLGARRLANVDQGASLPNVVGEVNASHRVPSDPRAAPRWQAAARATGPLRPASRHPVVVRARRTSTVATAGSACGRRSSCRS